MLRQLFLGTFPARSRAFCSKSKENKKNNTTLRSYYHNKTNTFAKMQSETVMDKRKITISVDGNISSGKSTLVSKLRELFPNDFNFHVELVPEPLEKWTDLRGNNLLGMFYDDPIKNNFVFQHYVQLTRLMETIKTPSPPEGEYKGIVRIMERSLQNNMFCFNELAKREGRLQQAEFAVLSEWYKWMEEKFDLNLDLIIYLRSDPETVHNRMQKRGRQEESSVPLGYLKSLHDTYEEWLIKGKLDCSPANTDLASESLRNLNVFANNVSLNTNLNFDHASQKVVVIDANQGKEEVARDCSNYLQKFMSETVLDKTSQSGHEINGNGC